MEINMKKQIGIATMEKFDNRQFNSVGSSRIRARWLLNYWPEAEEFVIGKKYEVLIFQKVYWANMMKAFDGIKILDLCDPDWLENKPVLEFADYADAITTSTEPLAEYIRKLRPNALVKCIPDRVLLSEAVPIKQDYGTELRKVAWFGYAQNTHYLMSTFDTLIAQGIELTIISNAPFDVPLTYRGKIKIHDVPYSYDSINKELVQCDAVLMPEPVGDQRARFKSNNKTLQAWSLAMPVIKVPEDLAKFANVEARKAEGQMKRKEIEEKWDVKYSVDEYREIIEQIKQKKATTLAPSNSK